MENPFGLGQSGQVQDVCGDQVIIDDKKLGLVKRFGNEQGRGTAFPSSRFLAFSTE